MESQIKRQKKFSFSSQRIWKGGLRSEGEDERERENEKNTGEIKNGDYIFKITTLASKIEVLNNCIILNYSVYQEELIGNYFSVLSFN